MADVKRSMTDKAQARQQQSHSDRGMEMWLEAISSAQVSPASGSAAALAGALGHALLIKLARLESWSGIPGNEDLLADLIAARNRMVALAQADAQALAAWPEASRPYTDGSVEREVSQTLVSVPRQGMEVCRQTLLRVQPFMGSVRAVAQPDAQAAIQLIETCQRALESLVEANLAQFPDLK
jgi:formiminotetrahydrofolate cyclodeaminase